MTHEDLPSGWAIKLQSVGDVMKALSWAVAHPFRALLALAGLGAGVSAAGSLLIMWVLDEGTD